MGSVLQLLLSAALLLGSGCGGAPHQSHPIAKPGAKFDAFAHTYAHDRGLAIKPDGKGREVINSGCCQTVIDFSFELSNPTGTVGNATVTYRVTAVRRWSRSWARRPRPSVGQHGRLSRKNRVITDSITGATFCDRVPLCGA